MSPRHPAPKQILQRRIGTDAPKRTPDERRTTRSMRCALPPKRISAGAETEANHAASISGSGDSPFGVRTPKRHTTARLARLRSFWIGCRGQLPRVRSPPWELSLEASSESLRRRRLSHAHQSVAFYDKLFLTLILHTAYTIHSLTGRKGLKPSQNFLLPMSFFHKPLSSWKPGGNAIRTCF